VACATEAYQICPYVAWRWRYIAGGGEIKRYECRAIQQSEIWRTGLVLKGTASDQKEALANANYFIGLLPLYI
jgi:hypothetical protein